jgi:hypothetical protein
VASGLLTAATNLGFGLPITELLASDIDLSQLVRMGMFNIIASVLLTFAVAWSKTSFAVTLLRLVHGWSKVWVWILIISINVFMGVTGVLILLSCTPVEKTWNPVIPGTCWPLGVNSSIAIASAGMRIPSQSSSTSVLVLS